MDKPLWMWGVFALIVGVLLALDLGLFHRKPRELTVRDSVKAGVFYVAIGLLFAFEIYFTLGSEPAQQYLTAYVLEKTLSIDNIFVMSLVFSYFAIPSQYQHRVLFWGIFGMLVLRAIMIALGATLIERFEWSLFIFAAFLIYGGVKMLFAADKQPDINNNPVLKLLRKHMPITPTLHGQAFFVDLPSTTGKMVRHATPLFVALVIIECADLIFAVDSIPAVFSVTADPYIVYTSNIFALLGLRAMYFLLAAMIHRFVYLKHALALVLIFIGSKTFIAHALGMGKFPSDISLGVTLGILGGGIGYSLLKKK